MVRSTRLDVVGRHESERSYRSSPDGSGHNPSTVLCVLPTFSMPLDAPRLASALQPSRCRDHPLLPMDLPRRHHSPSLGRPRAFNGEGRLTPSTVDGRGRRRKRQKMSGRADKQRQAVLRPFIDARVNLCPLGAALPAQCQPRVVCATELRSTAGGFRLSAHRCPPVRWSSFSVNRSKRNVAEHLRCRDNLLSQRREQSSNRAASITTKPKRCGQDVAYMPASDTACLTSSAARTAPLCSSTA